MVGFEHVGAGIEDGIAGKGRRLGDAVDAEGGDRAPSVAADQFRRAEPGQAVDQVGIDQGRGQLAAAFDQHPSQAAAAEPGIVAIFTGADLTDAYLSRADLSGADLRGAYLVRVDLYRADLTGADLSGATLTDGNLAMALLSAIGEVNELGKAKS